MTDNRLRGQQPRRVTRGNKHAMRAFADNEPLTDAELDRLGNFLKSSRGGKAMNLEELDGFFSALIAGPEPVMPSEYYREVFGGQMSGSRRVRKP